MMEAADISLAGSIGLLVVIFVVSVLVEIQRYR
jgi:hypothetical protein